MRLPVTLATFTAVLIASAALAATPSPVATPLPFPPPSAANPVIAPASPAPVPTASIVPTLVTSAALPAPPVHYDGSAGRILVLYKKRDPNHQGLLTIYTGYLRKADYAWDERDVESYVPSNPDTSDYDGIMTVYESNAMVGAERYALWLAGQLEAGQKVAIVGMYGAFQGMKPREGKGFVEWNLSTNEVNTFFWPFGLEFLPAFSNKRGTFEITRCDQRFARFEAPITEADVEKTGYQLFRSVDPRNTVHLAVRRSDLRDSESAFIVNTPFGGMILQGYTPYWDPNRPDPVTGAKGCTVQRTDMVAFLKACFSGEAPPVKLYDLRTHDELVKSVPLPRRAPPPDPCRQGPGIVRRRVLALYKRGDIKLTTKNESEPILERNAIRNRADLILTSLGVIPEYHAIEDGLLSDQQMERYLGIVTWYASPFMVDADRYNEWMLRQIAAGRKVVVIEEYGATIEGRRHTEVKSADRVFAALGMERRPLKLSRFERFPKIRTLDPAMMGFEHPLDAEEVSYRYRWLSKDPSNKVHLTVEDAYSGTIDLVVTNSRGGMALENSAFFFPQGDRERINLVREALAGRLMPEKAEEPTLGGWIVNPRRFFQTALGLGDTPVPDCTTMNGARIFYAHIDADGIESLSRIDGTFWAGRYITDEVLKRYPAVPQSVSVISRAVEKAGNRYYNPLVELAREIYRLPQIEVASHTSSHPFDWIGGDPYVTNPKSYPWKIAYREQNFVDEIWGSKLFIEANLVPPEKKMNVLLWSGATNPDERALEVCWRAGVCNLNGGDPICDPEHPTIAGLCPIGTPFGSSLWGPFRQIHTSARNDYIYMLFLLGDWDGQKKVVDHFARTDAPYRILPMNLYYHFYSGLKWDSIRALQSVLDAVVKLEPAMMHASQYCRIAEDYYRTTLTREAAGWWVENSGDLREIRIPGKVHVDPAASRGVLGYQHHRDDTYVHLDGSRRRFVALAPRPAAVPCVERCTWFLDSGRLTPGRLELAARGMGRFAMTLRGLGGGSWRLTMSDASGEVADQRFEVDGQGRARVAFDVTGGPAPRSIVVTRE